MCLVNCSNFFYNYDGSHRLVARMSAPQAEDRGSSPRESIMSFEESKKKIDEARKTLRAGFPCECGGIYRSAGRIGTILESDGFFYDAYRVRCDRCNSEDRFNQKLDHLGQVPPEVVDQIRNRDV